MVTYENDCHDCGIPCINCGLKSQPHLYCDSCGEEVSKVYKIIGYDESFICKDCLKKLIKPYTINDLIE